MLKSVSSSDFFQPTRTGIEDKTYFVHATLSFPETGRLIAGAKELGIFPSETYSKITQTLHFAVGSVIPAAEISGNRATYPYALIAGFQSLKTQLAEVSFLDSYIIGDLPFDNSMFLIIPEDQVLSKAIKDSHITIVAYNPNVEGISEVSKRVIQSLKGWVTKIDHKNFESYASVFMSPCGIG